MDVWLVSSSLQPTVKRAWERCRNTFGKWQLIGHAEFVAYLLPRVLLKLCDGIMLFIGSICGESALCI